MRPSTAIRSRWRSPGRVYAGFTNAGAPNNLFQGGFGSVSMDGDHVLAARTVALNPVQ